MILCTQHKWRNVQWRVDVEILPVKLVDRKMELRHSCAVISNLCANWAFCQKVWNMIGCRFGLNGICPVVLHHIEDLVLLFLHGMTSGKR